MPETHGELYHEFVSMVRKNLTREVFRKFEKKQLKREIEDIEEGRKQWKKDCEETIDQ